MVLGPGATSVFGGRQAWRKSGGASSKENFSLPRQPEENPLHLAGQMNSVSQSIPLRYASLRKEDLMASSALRYSITRYPSESDIDITQCLLENGSAALAALELDYPTDELTLVHYAMSVSGRAISRTLIEHSAEVNYAAGARGHIYLHGCSRADPNLFCQNAFGDRRSEECGTRSKRCRWVCSIRVSLLVPACWTRKIFAYQRTGRVCH